MNSSQTIFTRTFEIISLSSKSDGSGEKQQGKYSLEIIKPFVCFVVQYSAVKPWNTKNCYREKELQINVFEGLYEHIFGDVVSVNISIVSSQKCLY